MEVLEHNRSEPETEAEEMERKLTGIAQA